MKILLIESDPMDRKLIEIQFAGRKDCALVCADTVEQARIILSEEHFDAAVLGLSGSMRQFRKLHDAAPHLPVVVLLRHDDAELAAELIKNGAQDCLSKRHPLGDILERALRYAIERSHIKNELAGRMAQLSSGETMLRKVMDANSDAILVVDAKGAVSFANAAAAAMFGVTAQKLEGREFGHPIAAGDDIEIDILRHDHTRGRAEMRVAAIEWKGIAANLVSMRDVTVRVLREEALQAAERRLHRDERHLAGAQKLAAVGSFEIDLAALAFTGSEVFRRIFGYDAGEFDTWQSFIETVTAPQERIHVIENVLGARSAKPPPEIEYRFVRRDGATRRALQKSEIVFDEAGEPRALLCVVRDVTDLREAQARQREIEEKLRHAQRLEALGTLAGGIAHDLNNTLVPVRTLGSFLLQNIDAKYRSHLELIVRAGERATTLVREILTFSRKHPVEKERVRLDVLVKDVLVMLRAGLRSNIRIQAELSAVPEVLANSGQIYQIVLNLVTNAAQAIGLRPGEVFVRVGQAAGEPGGICLSVSDTGEGMDEETRKRIFEPFFTTKSASDGTGLGLSVVRGIVDGHNGTIDVWSKADEGTRFDVIFPLPDTEEILERASSHA